MKRYSLSILFSVLSLFLLGEGLANALSIKLSESAAPPGGVEQKVNSDQSKETKASKNEPGGSDGQSSSVEKSQAAAQAEFARFSGLFFFLKPIHKVFPIKTARVNANLVRMASNPGLVGEFKSHAIGSYFFEGGGKDIGPFKNFTGKIQLNRALRNSPVVNSMTEWSTKFRGADLKYLRTMSKSTSGTIASASASIQDNRAWSMDYKKDKGLALSWLGSHNTSETVGPSPSASGVEGQTISLQYPLTEKIKFSHQDLFNKNITKSSGDLSRNFQSDTKLEMPLVKKFGVVLSHQLVKNENLPGNGAGGQKNLKTTNTAGLTYQLTKDMKLIYSVERAMNQSTTPGQVTKFAASKRNLSLDGPLTPWASFKVGMETLQDATTGRTGIRIGGLSLKHDKFKFFPGVTTFDSRRQFVRTGPNSTYDTSVNINTPLTYFNNRLRVNLQNAFTHQKNLVTQDVNQSRNQTYTVDYQISQRMAMGTSYAKVKTSSNSAVGLTSRTTSLTRSDKLTFTLPRLFRWKLGNFDKLQYTFSMPHSKSKTHFPAVSESLTRGPAHGLSFGLKGSKWQGNYSVDRSFAFVTNGERQRSFQHKVDLSVQTRFGILFTANYARSFQKSGGQATGVFKLSKKQSEKINYFSSFELLQNKSYSDVTKNGKNRYFEAGIEFSF